ncbi:MAG: alternative ribosome rescue aminoacyl-tRNA hydrolase ArfB [Synechococcaceae cyanobacterium]|nr:alternative ribosome rescue aminoacyl-tRNA hydrolase ArfB [Synechococcaceae cyanobacterium]
MSAPLPGTDLQLPMGGAPALTIAAAELRWRFSRASGPGGQHLNKTDSRAELRFDLAGSASLPASLRQRALQRLGPRLVDGCLTITASEQRSQWQNRLAAQRRLLELLQEALKPPPPPRRRTRPSRGSVERRLATKKQRSAVKQQRRTPAQTPDN